MSDPLVEYYSRRAPEYEQIWQRDEPARQAEQAALAADLRKCFLNRRVLEVACGTGYWTQMVAEVAQHVCAIDASPEMLARARGKMPAPGNVEFRRGDAYDLGQLRERFTGGLANFWLSHVPKARVDEFLRGFHSRLEPGAAVFLADNVYVRGLGGELVNCPESEDTWKLRELADGSKHVVLKNYYDREQLERIFAPRATGLEVCIGQCFWRVSYVVP